MKDKLAREGLEKLGIRFYESDDEVQYDYSQDPRFDEIHKLRNMVSLIEEAVKILVNKVAPKCSKCGQITPEKT